MAFVQIILPDSKSGTMSDINGHFDLTVTHTDSLLHFRMMGYRPQTIKLKNRSSRRQKIGLEPLVTTLQTVNVSAKKSKRERYQRKNNPAVKLVRQVIDHKEENSIISTEKWSRRVFEKLNVCLDQFHPDFEKHLFWKHFPFVEKYIGQAEFDNTEILHSSIHERMSTQDYAFGNLRTLVTANRTDGVDVNISQEGSNNDIDALFPAIDIYANEIALMSVRFVSPLSSLLATTFYQYHITDTVEIDGQRCIELSFVPASKSHFGFVGSMYIVDDGTYAVKRYAMRVPKTVDLNYVRDLNIQQNFVSDSLGHHIPSRMDIYCRFYVGKRIRQIYAHKTLLYYDYSFDAPIPMPDSLFTPLATVATLPNAHKMPRKVWNAQRPMELSLAETFLDSMRFELMRIPTIRHSIKTVEVLLTNYIPTHSTRDSSRFDFGPIYNIVSHNGIEGLRLRVGGMSTARLNNRNFFDGYIAYGVNDQQFKFDLNLIHTFKPKRRFPMESPLGYISLHAGYDIASPGLSFDKFDRDNIMMWTSKEVPVQYVADLQLRMRRQWPRLIGVDIRIGAQHIRPTGMLNYYRITSSETERVNSIFHTQWATHINFSPNTLMRSNRSDKSPLFNLSENASSFTLSHEMGLLDGFYYNRSQFSLFSRLWFAVIGYFDFRMSGGILWNPVPMPQLFIPNGNSSYIMSEYSFNTMQPMEFIMDRYVSALSTYHMKGLILNHIPLIKHLKLREVVGFNILYGTLSEMNNPSRHQIGLYMLPTHANFLSKEPYMEFSIGIENILKLIRIDYVRRLSYLEGAASPHAIKFSLQLTM